MAARRARQPVRIAVRAAGTTKATITAAAAAAAAGTVAEQGRIEVRRLDPRKAGEWIVTLRVPDAIGSPGYASTAWEIAHRLRDADGVTLAEADIPVGAFDPRTDAAGALATTDCSGDASSADREWALDTIGWQAALALMDPAVRGGVGIRIGHPDSGFTDHFALGATAVDQTTDWDVIDNDDDAADPLRPPRPTFANPLPNPGHGTSTASVILGRGDGNGFSGVAPAATLVSFRATESVVQVFDSDVADAVRRARLAGCQVVSMSLGGTGFFGLREAIQMAVDSGMIVMAAAGNQVGVVTAPASYDNCIAVAATGPGDVPWAGSSRGAAVDVAAPGRCVWAALFDWAPSPPGRIVARTNGTSYAVAHLAGAAALWLAHHGYPALVTRYGAPQVQAAFLHQLRLPGVCARPPGWDDDWGVGRVDAEALLAAPLPDPTALDGVGAFGTPPDADAVERLAALTDVPPARVQEWLTETLGPTDVAKRADRFAGELAYLLLEDQSFRAGLVQPGLRAFSTDTPPAAASPRLRAALEAR